MKTLDDYLNAVDYSYLNSAEYRPSKFALEFTNFIKLVNGEAGESNKTPPMHLAMLDKLGQGERYIANICFRGSAKALALDTPILTEHGWTIIKYLDTGSKIYGENGKPTTVLAKSEVFNKSMYKLVLADGRSLKVSDDHLNVVLVGGNRQVLSTTEVVSLLAQGVKVSIPLAKAVQTPLRRLRDVDPYVMGLNIQRSHVGGIPREYLLADIDSRKLLLAGLLCADGTVVVASEYSARDVCLLAQSLGYLAWVTRSMHTGQYLIEVDRQAVSIDILAIRDIPNEPSQCIYVDNDLHTFCAGEYIVTHNTTLFMEYLTLYLAVIGELPGLGKVDGMIYVSDTMENGAKNARKNIQFRYENSEFLQKWIRKAEFTDGYLEFRSVNHKRLGVELYGASTGIRGKKIFGKRPGLAILDDVIPEGGDRSPTILNHIKDVIYKGVNHALDTSNRMVIFSGTPFSKEDPITEAVESGAWSVNVWPVCDRFPVSRDEFKGAWPDRFTYDYVNEQYQLALNTGKIASFNQELMLRIATEEDRLIQEEDIRWYKRTELLNSINNFNIYITTDFATSEKQSADYSVISVWAYNSNGDWFYIDGVVVRQTMDKSIDDLFRLVQMYNPQQVGIEVTGQQGAFISWLQKEMMQRNIWFNFAGTGNSPGIRPVTNKFTRFNLVLPWFKAGKMYFPDELKSTNSMGIFMGQLRLITTSGIKGKDDCIDTVSMLGYLNAWKPSAATEVMERQQETNVWEVMHMPEPTSAINSYIV